MAGASIPIGIYVIVSGVLLGFAVAVIVAAIMDDVGGPAAVAAILAFIGVSGTTIGVGVLVILMGRVLSALGRS